ncbi:hypothetical protein Ddc_01576 [Ditylenchus destructor]|nr:hypothetical protein Ddc_01576 [Ditylenchus destructor]
MSDEEGNEMPDSGSDIDEEEITSGGGDSDNQSMNSDKEIPQKSRKVQYKKPTSFKFISIDSVKDFNLLCWKLTNENNDSETHDAHLENMDQVEGTVIQETSSGGKSITFTLKSKGGKSTRDERQKQHVQERKKVRRSAGEVMRFVKPMRKGFGQKSHQQRRRNADKTK